MGIGSSNLSISELDILQQSITEISSDVKNATENIASVELNTKQNIIFQNGVPDPPDTYGCSKVSERRTAYTTNCKESCKEICDSYKFNSDFELYFSCIEACNKATKCDDVEFIKELIPECSEIVLKATNNGIINCNVNIQQNSNNTSTLDQVAATNTDTQMMSKLMNNFQSTIDKAINQKNKDFSFNQHNTSKERTSMTQSVRNSMKQAVSASASNLSTTYQNTEQNINFQNYGVINCGDCGTEIPPNEPENNTFFRTIEGSGNVGNSCGTLNISQDSFQKADISQTATSILKAVMDNDVINDLTSDYKFAATQSNEGIDPASLIFLLLLLLMLPLIMMIYTFSSFIKVMLDVIGQILIFASKIFLFATMTAIYSVVVIFHVLWIKISQLLNKNNNKSVIEIIGDDFIKVKSYLLVDGSFSGQANKISTTASTGWDNASLKTPLPQGVINGFKGITGKT